MEGDKVVTLNRKARHDYDILETCEAGIVLKGTEVKSARNGRVSLNESYAKVIGSDAYILGMHIAPYEAGNRENAEPTRPRRLLLHRREISHFTGKTQERGLTLVPLKFYFQRGRAKVELGLGRGRKTHDKRQVLAERDAQRDIDRTLTNRDY
ncbi:MAG: SsrA-binding protein SmpB [Armatimonadetes bacterium]|nr:SsrA-binding protein SmpB [Armatimonadota bacterium]